VKKLHRTLNLNKLSADAIADLRDGLERRTGTAQTESGPMGWTGHYTASGKLARQRWTDTFVASGKPGKPV
jgi:hypothetical protein